MSKLLSGLTESAIHIAFKKKVSDSRLGKRSQHPVMILEIDNVEIDRVTIPLNHKKSYFSVRESKRIARQLFLTDEEFLGLVKCTLKKKEFYKILKERYNAEPLVDAPPPHTL